MALHQRAMAVCNAASLLFSIGSGASPSPDTPGAALTQGTNPQAVPTPGGFACPGAALQGRGRTSEHPIIITACRLRLGANTVIVQLIVGGQTEGVPFS